MVRIKKLLALAGVIALLAPTAAFAQSSNEGYGGSNDVVAGLETDSGSGGGSAGSGGSGGSTGEADGSLPFTGSDLSVLVAAGGLLLGVGFGLRRLTHRPTEA